MGYNQNLKSFGDGTMKLSATAMRGGFCALAAWVLCGGALAGSYYVDSVAGNDNNAGTSSGAPWKNLTKATSRTYQPGDKILLKRGSLWRQMLVVPSSGSAAAPIVIEAYGAGARPDIRGADLLTGFTQHSGNIWKVARSTSPTQVFFNELRGAKQTTLSTVNAALKWYWTSSTLYVYSAGNPGTVYTAPGIESTARDHAVSFNSKSNVIVRGLGLEKTRGNVVFMSNTIQNCTLEDCILLQGPPDPGGDNASILLSSNSQNCEIKDCTLGKDSGPGNEVADQGWASYGGIQIKGRNHRVHGNYVYHNAVENENAFGFNAYGIRLAIVAGRMDVYDNVVHHTGSSGIYMDADTIAGDQVHIYNNQCTYCGQAGIAVYKTRAADGAGGVGYIYRNQVSYCDRLAGQTGGNGNAACGIHFNDQAQSGTDPAHPFIKWYCFENHVHHCQASASPRNEDSGGIALDFNANRVEVFRNLVHDNWGKGLYIYNADRCNVYANIFYGNDAGIVVSALSTNGETAYDNQVFNNTLYMNYNGDAYGPGYNCEILFGMNSNRVAIKNNILYASPSGYTFYLFPGSSGVAVDKNCVYKDSGSPCYSNTTGARTWAQWQGMGYDLSGLNVSPGFMNAAARDFRLGPASPCINNGTSLPDPFGTVFSTNQAPFPYPTTEQGSDGSGWEMGAFSFVDTVTLDGIQWIRTR